MLMCSVFCQIHICHFLFVGVVVLVIFEESYYVVLRGPNLLARQYYERISSSFFFFVVRHHPPPFFLLQQDDVHLFSQRERGVATGHRSLRTSWSCHPTRNQAWPPTCHRSALRPTNMTNRHCLDVSSTSMRWQARLRSWHQLKL